MEWFLGYEENQKCMNWNPASIEEIKKSGMKIIKACVPGNVEIDFMREGLIDDLYFSCNVLQARNLENLHYWYFTKFNIEDTNIYAEFAGIDTVADIYVNGKLVKSTDNMFVSYDVYGDFIKGENEIVVHIKPVCIEARKYPLPAACTEIKYGYSSLYMRKAPHMYGWDIMPRIVSAGIWKPVTIKKIKNEHINEVYFVTNYIKEDMAAMRLYLNVDVLGDFIDEYSVNVSGKCGDSIFEVSEKLYHTSNWINIKIKNPQLWWPKNYGEQPLYDTKIELIRNEEILDVYRMNVGIRTVDLIFEEASENSVGEFEFEVNGKKIFILGTNWVPLDALHSNDVNRSNKALDMLDDLGCNMVRCWGGNVYESDEFFDFCDRKGILVWQDFALACGIYPQDNNFAKKIEEEAVYQVKRLRNHPSLAIWSGDNEGDLAYSWTGVRRNPNENRINREVLKGVVLAHDYRRPYIPSSPYITENTYVNKLPLPEDHLWGVRNYFKSDFYKNAACKFASEIGYYAFPSPESLKKFLKNPERIFDENGTTTNEYLIHASSPVPDENELFGMRIKVAYEQAARVFDTLSEDIYDFTRQSQITQAEAIKYFIESFRINKKYKTGIMWWNLIDGWPQVSDAVIDYYFTKKLAYNYIKASQQPLCLMMDEPVSNKITLCGVNEFAYDADIEYWVTRASSDEIVLSGKVCLSSGECVRIGEVNITEGEQEFYIIKWMYEGNEFTNHYFTNLMDVDYKKYTEMQKKYELDTYEGF